MGEERRGGLPEAVQPLGGQVHTFPRGGTLGTQVKSSTHLWPREGVVRMHS